MVSILPLISTFPSLFSWPLGTVTRSLVVAVVNTCTHTAVGFLNTNSLVLGDTENSGWTPFDGMGNSLSWNRNLRPSRHRILGSWHRPTKSRTYSCNERASNSLDCLGNSLCEEERTVSTSCCECFYCCLNDSKSLQGSRTLLSILAYLNNAVV